MEKTTILNSALKYYRLGFTPLPANRKTKAPLVSWKQYQEKRPSEDEVKHLFEKYPQANVALITGRNSGIIVVDVDGEVGIQTIKNMNINTSNVPMVKTGRGWHLYYKYPNNGIVSNFQGKAGLEGIDLRAQGGIAIVPPSIHENGNEYKWVKPLSGALEDLPKCILAESNLEKTPLKELYKGTTEGNRNNCLARLAGSWLNDDLTYDECMENAHIWNTKNTSPLSEPEIERTIKSILQKHEREKGACYPEFEAQQTNTDILSRLRTWNQIKKMDIKVEYSVNHIIVKGAINVIFGKGGIGKTYLTMDMARCIGSGTPWLGFDTIKSPVVFLDFENALAVLSERIKKLDRGNTQNVYFWDGSLEDFKLPKLDTKEWVQYKSLPQDAVIILDTLRASQSGDENASNEMSLIMGRLKELRNQGRTIIVLHHTPKNTDNVSKGSTAIVDQADHVLGLVMVKKKSDGKDIILDDEDEFEADALYRFGHGGKTRYKPYCIYLSFDPDHGFTIAPDPQEEIFKDMYELLRRNGTLNKTSFIEKCKSINIATNRARRLINAGSGRYWDIENVKSHNSQLIRPRSHLFSSTPLYSSEKLTKWKNTENELKEIQV